MSETLNTQLAAAVAHGEPREIRRLIAAGADVNDPDLLGIAVRRGHRRALGNLLGAGAPLGPQPTAHCRAAIRRRDKGVLRLLLTRTTPEDDRYGDLTLAAARAGDADSLALLLVAGFALHEEAVVAAAWAGHLDVLAVLLEAGADPHGLDGGALLSAVRRGHTPFVIELLKSGAPPGDAGVRALAGAIHNKNTALAKILLAAGVPVGGPDRNLLKSAVDTRDIELVRVLLQYGADVNESGGSPLWSAMQQGLCPIIALLRESGADLEGPGINMNLVNVKRLRRYSGAVQVAVLASGTLPFRDAIDFAWHGVRPEGILTVLRRTRPDQAGVADFLTATQALEHLSPSARAGLLKELLPGSKPAATHGF